MYRRIARPDRRHIPMLDKHLPNIDMAVGQVCIYLLSFHRTFASIQVLVEGNIALINEIRKSLVCSYSKNSITIFYRRQGKTLSKLERVFPCSFFYPPQQSGGEMSSKVLNR
jgi:hypothetical protein